jgi:hypothetical protein
MHLIRVALCHSAAHMDGLRLLAMPLGGSELNIRHITPLSNIMNLQQKSFELYLTVIRFIAYKVTPNVRRIYLDVNHTEKECIITGLFNEPPSDLEKELFGDIVTNSIAHIPDYSVIDQIQTITTYDNAMKHDFTVYAVYEDYEINDCY